MALVSYALSILSGIIATVICYSFQRAYKYAKTYKNSEYSGTWMDEIYSDDTRRRVIKKDRYEIKHNKKDHTIEGNIEREYPEKQRHRKWKFNGVIDGRYIILSFWSMDMQKSNGCIYAKLNDDYEYEGYYLEEHGTAIDMTPIKLYKVRAIEK